MQPETRGSWKWYETQRKYVYQFEERVKGEILDHGETYRAQLVTTPGNTYVIVGWFKTFRGAADRIRDMYEARTGVR